MRAADGRGDGQFVELPPEDGQFCRLTGAHAELRGGKLTHYAVDRLGNWKPSKLTGHGQVVVSVKLCDTAYSTLHLAPPGVGQTVRVEACPDSGAMMVVCGPRQVEDMGFSTKDLLLPATDIKTADGTPAKVLGALFVEISGNDRHGEEVLSKQLMYCMEGVDNIYLSKECSIQLGILDPDFPRIGGAKGRQKQDMATAAPVRSRGRTET